MFAIMPPEKTLRRISSERDIFAVKYNCVRALKPPVHITLYPPFSAPNDIEQSIQKIGKWAETQRPIHIELRNYNYFKNPISPVVYIDVVKNDNLKILQRKFTEQLKKYIKVETTDRPYSPHFTIGYRDVPPAILPTIVEEYSTRRFSESFDFDRIYLWKHDRKNWQVLREFKFLAKPFSWENPLQQSLF